MPHLEQRFESITFQLRNYLSHLGENLLDLLDLPVMRFTLPLFQFQFGSKAVIFGSKLFVSIKIKHGWGVREVTTLLYPEIIKPSRACPVYFFSASSTLASSPKG